MVRITKDPDIRKQEIIDTANTLFVQRGYNKTSISDITKTIGIAQGTFYYYFKTKEDVLDAIVKNYVKGLIEKIRPVSENNDLDVIDKMKYILQASYSYDLKNYPAFQNLHVIKNVDMQQKFLIEITKQFVPIICVVLSEGIEKGIFKVKYPVEILEIILVGTNFMMDSSNFEKNTKERFNYFFALQEMLEKVLEVKEGTFRFITDVFEGFNDFC